MKPRSNIEKEAFVMKCRRYFVTERKLLQGKLQQSYNVVLLLVLSLNLRRRQNK